jgi:hypothetical protein
MWLAERIAWGSGGLDIVRLEWGARREGGSDREEKDDDVKGEGEEFCEM